MVPSFALALPIAPASARGTTLSTFTNITPRDLDLVTLALTRMFSHRQPPHLRSQHHQRLLTPVEQPCAESERVFTCLIPLQRLLLAHLSRSIAKTASGWGELYWRDARRS
nr:hypothetical protein CFP56_68334 [Quercus suber]